jgi:DNA-binding NtrC family response regulator
MKTNPKGVFMLIKVAILSKQDSLSKNLSEMFRAEGALAYEFTEKDNLHKILQGEYDIYVINESLLPAQQLETIQQISNLPNKPSLIVLAESNVEKKQAAYVSAGCAAALYSGVNEDLLCEALKAIFIKHINHQNEIINRKRLIEEPRLSDFVSESESMQIFMNLARRVVNSDSSLLILGETGVGKERLSLAIHGESKRKMFPFIAVNCAALPDALLESELFGHEKGAFTGAFKARKGAFELAHQGTIFLDEVGDMPLHLQVKLLRALQEKQIQKIGSEKSIKVDVRVMAATNKDLRTEVEKGNFRKDLYYRICVVSLTIPPLSQRKEDIPELAKSYVEYLSPRIGVNVKTIQEEALEALVEYKWPGNVRELINVLERAMLLCDSETITALDLPDEIHLSPRIPSDTSGILDTAEKELKNWTALPWKKARKKLLDHFEKLYLEELMNETGGNVEEAAQKAQMTPRAVYYKLKDRKLSPKSIS